MPGKVLVVTSSTAAPDFLFAESEESDHPEERKRAQHAPWWRRHIEALICMMGRSPTGSAVKKNLVARTRSYRFTNTLYTICYYFFDFENFN